MEKPKLQPSHVRDILAVLNEARKGGEWVGTHKVSERTGLGYMTARAKLLALVEQGLAEHSKLEGVDHYRATDAAEEMLR